MNHLDRVIRREPNSSITPHSFSFNQAQIKVGPLSSFIHQGQVKA